MPEQYQQEDDGEDDRDDLLGRRRQRQHSEHEKNYVDYEGKDEEPDEERHKAAPGEQS